MSCKFIDDTLVWYMFLLHQTLAIPHPEVTGLWDVICICLLSLLPLPHTPWHCLHVPAAPPPTSSGSMSIGAPEHVFWAIGYMWTLPIRANMSWPLPSRALTPSPPRPGRRALVLPIPGLSHIHESCMSCQHGSTAQGFKTKTMPVLGKPDSCKTPCALT